MTISNTAAAPVLQIAKPPSGPNLLIIPKAGSSKVVLHVVLQIHAGCGLPAYQKSAKKRLRVGLTGRPPPARCYRNCRNVESALCAAHRLEWLVLRSVAKQPVNSPVHCTGSRRVTRHLEILCNLASLAANARTQQGLEDERSLENRIVD